MAITKTPLNPGEKPDSRENKLRRAADCIDLMLPHFPEFQEVNIMQVADEAPLHPLDKQMIRFLRDEIEELLIIQFGYVAKDLPNNFYGRLTDKGKEARAAGGHFAYLKQLETEKEKVRKRQELADKTARFEWNKGRPIKVITPIIALVAVIIALATF